MNFGSLHYIVTSFTLQGMFILTWCLTHSGDHRNCWSTYEDCVVQAQLLPDITTNTSNDFLKIDCWPLPSSLTNNGRDHVVKIAPAVILDGCRTSLDYERCSFELLPNCEYITQSVVQHFHMDSLKPLKCSPALNHPPLQLLHFHNNEIGTIDSHSFLDDTHAQLQELEFMSNSLRYIVPSSMQHLKSLRILRIVNERMLSIQADDFLLHIHAAQIYLKSIKLLTAKVFQNLPASVQALLVSETAIDTKDVQVLNNGILHNLTIVNCFVESFTLTDRTASVALLNLSGNNLKYFTITTTTTTTTTTNIQTLDLSHNHLIMLPQLWLKNLANLTILNLKMNDIKMLNLHHILSSLPNACHLDISYNRLASLLGINETIHPMMLSQLHLHSSHNPWDCLWLHQFAHCYPEKFRIMDYSKYIARINVNGLECVPTERQVYAANETIAKSNNDFITISKPVINVTAYNLLYGDQPWELKRNQRAEALIILFMLPIGIALLFLLLYMWIYCQKVFHLSYYQNFTCRRSSRGQPAFAAAVNPSSAAHLNIICRMSQDTATQRMAAVFGSMDEGQPAVYEDTKKCDCQQIPITDNDSTAGQRDNRPESLHTFCDSFPKVKAHNIYERIVEMPQVTVFPPRAPIYRN